MIVPYKPSKFEKAHRLYKYIIIHDLSCKFSNIDNLVSMDTKKSIASTIRSYNWIFGDEFDLPYHFLCEKIGKDYETIMGTPLCYHCKYDDIPDPYANAIHIGVAGDFSVAHMTQRAYQQIGYRSIASVAKWFGIPLSKIYTHNEVSTDKDIACPGPFFDKAKLMAAIKPLVLMKG